MIIQTENKHIEELSHLRVLAPKDDRIYKLIKR